MCVVAGQQLLNPARDKARHRGDIHDGVTPREQPDHLNVPRRGRIRGRPEPRFQILDAQMISNPRHSLPPRLMAHQPTRFATAQESTPSPSPGPRITHPVQLDVITPNTPARTGGELLCPKPLQTDIRVGRLPWELVWWCGDPRAPRCPMSCHQKDPLRPLTAEERQELTRLSRSLSAPAAQVERARALLAIADGASYTAAAHQVGRRHTETISAWVSRFNRDGLAAVRPGHGGGARIRYGADAQQRILAEWARTPQRDQDGTATWSVSLLQRALRQADDGLPQVSTFTIWRTLHAGGLSWQKSRTWCETGVGLRHRKHGVVRVRDPDALAKKS